MNKATITVHIQQRHRAKTLPPEHQEPVSLDSIESFVQKTNLSLTPIPIWNETHTQESSHLDEWSAWMSDHAEVHRTVHVADSRSMKFPWIRIITSVGGAVITGILMGICILQLIQYKESASPHIGTEHRVAQPASTHPVDLDQKSFMFIQSGVFTSLDSAKLAQSQLHQLGLSSYIVQGEQQTVYVGFAVHKSDASELITRFREKNLDVFVKQIDIPAFSSHMTRVEQGESWGTFLQQTDVLIRKLHDYTLERLAQKDGASINPLAVTMIADEHHRWVDLMQPLMQVSSESIQFELQSMTDAMRQSVTSVQSYQEQPVTNLLWETQSHVMKMIFSQKRLLEMIS